MTTPAAALPSDRFALLGQAIDRMRAALAPAMPSLISEVAADLERSAASQAEERDRRTLQAAGAMLRMESRRREERAYDALEEFAHRCLEVAQRAGDEAGALSSLDEGDARLHDLAAELAAAIRACAGRAYEDYAMRVSSLMPGLWRNDDLNPLGARTLAVAAFASFRGLGESPAMSVALRDALHARVPQACRSVIGEIRGWLESAAVLGATGDEPGRAGQAPARFGGDAIVRAAETVHALGLSPFEVARSEPRLRLVPALRPVMEIEGDAIAFARSVGAEPFSRQARGAFFARVRERLSASAAPTAHCAVVDVVAAMFDYVVDDRRFPEHVRSLVWRLQLPAVALALMDPAYLGDGPKSLRRLIESVGSIAGAHTDELAPGAALSLRLESIVRGVEAVAAALQARVTAISRQLAHEYDRAAEGVAMLAERVEGERVALEGSPERRNRRDFRSRPGRDREKEVTDWLAGLLRERLEHHPVPDSIREFLFNVWLRQLRTAALRDGEQSAAFGYALQVVDDLLWSVDTGGERHARGELAQRIPRLIRALSQGARDTGAREDEYKFFFDELFLLHLRGMQPRRLDGGAEAEGGAPAQAPA